MVLALLLRAPRLQLLMLRQRLLPAHLELAGAVLVLLPRALQLRSDLPNALFQLNDLVALAFEGLAQAGDIVTHTAGPGLRCTSSRCRLPHLGQLLPVALDVTQELAEHLVPLRPRPLLVAPLLEPHLLLAHGQLQLLDLALNALRALGDHPLQALHLLSGMPDLALAVGHPLRAPGKLGLHLLNHTVGRLAGARELVDGGLRLLHLLLSCPHLLQLRVVLLLGRSQAGLLLVGLIDELKAFGIQRVQVLLHACDDDYFRLFVPAEVDDPAENGPEAL
mmetsp:Transcript_114878/g.245256  ORF Transcript_114878/g.245256 Transcript_114878/m.245256 type:complete len:278 (+) Transcript_114878:327-1160(+)